MIRAVGTKAVGKFMPEFGVTRERIRQIENKALSTIKRNRRAIELLRDFRAA